MITETSSMDKIADMIRLGQLDQASQALDREQETEENRLELAFLRAYYLESIFDAEGAAEGYRKILEEQSNHTEAAFRLALIADHMGDEETAITHYELCVRQQRAPVQALMNLSLLFEEKGYLERAEKYLNDIITGFPNHTRAKRYLQSVKSSYTMVYDEQTLREREKHDAVLDMPISDFELSVRSRNCLRQMNIRSLGDLLSTTEYELLSYKNFGETSLNEIKAMLTQKGLKLGQTQHAADLIPAAVPTLAMGAITPAQPLAPAPAPAANSSFSASVTELELSVRARKALQRLGVVTMGELTVRTEAELMSIKNFGQTSLNEIKQQLSRFGLTFKQPGT